MFEQIWNQAYRRDNIFMHENFNFYISKAFSRGEWRSHEIIGI